MQNNLTAEMIQVGKDAMMDHLVGVGIDTEDGWDWVTDELIIVIYQAMMERKPK